MCSPLANSSCRAVSAAVFRQSSEEMLLWTRALPSVSCAPSPHGVTPHQRARNELCIRPVGPGLLSEKSQPGWRKRKILRERKTDERGVSMRVVILALTDSVSHHLRTGLCLHCSPLGPARHFGGAPP